MLGAVVRSHPQKVRRIKLKYASLRLMCGAAYSFCTRLKGAPLMGCGQQTKDLRGYRYATSAWPKVV